MYFQRYLHQADETGNSETTEETETPIITPQPLSKLERVGNFMVATKNVAVEAKNIALIVGNGVVKGVKAINNFSRKRDENYSESLYSNLPESMKEKFYQDNKGLFDSFS